MRMKLRHHVHGRRSESSVTNDCKIATYKCDEIGTNVSSHIPDTVASLIKFLFFVLTNNCAKSTANGCRLRATHRTRVWNGSLYTLPIDSFASLIPDDTMLE